MLRVLESPLTTVGDIAEVAELLMLFVTDTIYAKALEAHTVGEI